MNKQGQVNVGTLILVAIVAIVGAILLTATAQYVGDVTNTVDVANASLASANGTTNASNPELSGKSVSSVVVYNGSDDIIVGSGNYTIYNNYVKDGEETVIVNVSCNPTSLQAQDWNISYTYEPTTYDSSSGGRAIAGLIVVFFAIAIAISMLIPTLRSKILRR